MTILEIVLILCLISFFVGILAGALAQSFYSRCAAINVEQKQGLQKIEDERKRRETLHQGYKNLPEEKKREVNQLVNRLMGREPEV